MSSLNLGSKFGSLWSYIKVVWQKLLIWLIEVAIPMSFIIAVSIVFLFYYYIDLLVLYIINLTFFDVVNKEKTAKSFIDNIKNFSLKGTIVAFTFTLIFFLFVLLIVAIKASFNISGRSKGRELVSLKSNVTKLCTDTGTTFKNVTKFTIIFGVTIGVVKLILLVVSDASTYFVVIASFVVAIYYVSALVISLIGYGWDLAKLVREL